MESIKEKYNNYINKVSQPDQAISLELALYLYEWCKLNEPRSIVDLGSGFSSYILRMYAKATGSLVYSVDDNLEWLNKTRQFLQQDNLNVENMMLWEEFKFIDNKFDFIVYDLGDIPTRKTEINFIFDKLNQNGTIILDDAHFDDNHWSAAHPRFNNPTLRTMMESSLTQYNYNYISLYSQTVDTYGRYALQAYK